LKARFIQNQEADVPAIEKRKNEMILRQKKIKNKK
jgi:hypothetical protein